MRDNELDQIEFESLPKQWSDLLNYFVARGISCGESDDIWEYLVKTYLTEQYAKANCKAMVEIYWKQFLPNIEQWKQEQFDLFHAVTFKYDQWMKGRLQTIEPGLKQTLLNKQDSQGDTALHYAIYHKHLPALVVLLSHQANVDLQNVHGDTPMHRVAVTQGGIFAEKLLACKPDLTKKNSQGLTPLHMSVFHRAVDVVDKIIKIDPERLNDVNSQGETVLFFAAKQGDLDVLKILVGNQVSLEQRNSQKLTPMQMAASELNIRSAESLMALKVDLNHAEPSLLFLAWNASKGRENLEAFVKLLLAHGLQVEPREMDAIERSLQNSRYLFSGQQIGLLYKLKEMSQGAAANDEQGRLDLQ